MKLTESITVWLTCQQSIHSIFFPLYQHFPTHWVTNHHHLVNILTIRSPSIYHYVNNSQTQFFAHSVTNLIFPSLNYPNQSLTHSVIYSIQSLLNNPFNYPIISLIYLLAKQPLNVLPTQSKSPTQFETHIIYYYINFSPQSLFNNPSLHVSIYLYNFTTHSIRNLHNLPLNFSLSQSPTQLPTQTKSSNDLPLSYLINSKLNQLPSPNIFFNLPISQAHTQFSPTPSPLYSLLTQSSHQLTLTQYTNSIYSKYQVNLPILRLHIILSLSLYSIQNFLIYRHSATFSI